MFESGADEIMDRKLQGLERFGQLVGEKVLPWMVDRYKEKAQAVPVIIRGEEYLNELQGVAAIIAPNHIEPETKVGQKSQLPPDVFHTWNLVEKVLGKNLAVLAKCDDGWWSKNWAYRWIQKVIQKPITKGVIEGHEQMIPVEKNPGSLNRQMIKEARLAIEDKKPIILFPEGHWYEEFNMDHEVEGGMAYLAIRSGDVPICPVYIQGARNFSPEDKTVMCVGKAFKPSEVLGVEPDELAKLKGKKLRENIDLLNAEWQKRVQALKDGYAHVETEQARL